MAETYRYIRSGARALGTMGALVLLTGAACFMFGTPVAHAKEANNVKKFTFTASRKVVNIGMGLTYNAWTYDGQVPGPLIRVQQGDEVQITLINHTNNAHGLDTHAAQIDSNKFIGKLGAKSLTYRFRAKVPGVFDYHCFAPPVLDHVASGMYGMTIVDPKDGWPNGKAQEVMLVEGGFYGLPNSHGFIRGDHAKMIAGTPDFVVFNGKISHYGKSSPIVIKSGKLVRIFFVNIGPSFSSTFHIMGAIFSTVYRSGNPADALHNIQSFEVGPGDAAVFEFTPPEPGSYVFLDHNLSHAYKGAMGTFKAIP